MVSDLLGHATVAFTMDVYAHAIPSMQSDAMDLVSRLVWGDAGAPDDLDDAPPTEDPDRNLDDEVLDEATEEDDDLS